MAGAPAPPPTPTGAETPISGSAGDEEPQHHFGATSGIRGAKEKEKGKKKTGEETDRKGGQAVRECEELEMELAPGFFLNQFSLAF